MVYLKEIYLLSISQAICYWGEAWSCVIYPKVKIFYHDNNFPLTRYKKGSACSFLYSVWALSYVIRLQVSYIHSFALSVKFSLKFIHVIRYLNTCWYNHVV